MSVSIVVAVAAVLAGAGPEESPAGIFESQARPTVRNRIDEIVFARLNQASIAPANVCSDAAFVRRVYLDVIGTLPTADDASQFLADTDPDKRSKLIDRLLEREEYAD